MDTWKKTFLDKLNRAQGQWVKRFEDAMEEHFVPVFDECRQFLSDNGFRLGIPLREPGRRSYKFELSENAYLLMIFRSLGVGEFELRCESFVPAREPVLDKTVARIADFNAEWATARVHAGLDTFVDLLAGCVPAPVSEEVSV